MNCLLEPLKFLRDFFWVPPDPHYPDVLNAYDLEHINKRIERMALNFDKLAEEVKQLEDTQFSAIAVINGLKEELKSVSEKLATANADTGELDKLIERLDTSTEALAAAIATNPAPTE